LGKLKRNHNILAKIDKDDRALVNAGFSLKRWENKSQKWAGKGK